MPLSFHSINIPNPSAKCNNLKYFLTIKFPSRTHLPASQAPVMLLPAYLKEGIDLNTGKCVPHFPGMESIVFAQEVWSRYKNERASARASR